MIKSLEEFYTNLVEITEPWEVSSIMRDSKTRVATAIVELRDRSELTCPICGKVSKLCDHRKRRWWHLDSCNHKTLIEADIPRVSCVEHGVKQMITSWAEKNSRFTLESESNILLCLKDDLISTIANNFELTWDEVDRIMTRAVRRGFSRRKKNYTKKNRYRRNGISKKT